MYVQQPNNKFNKRLGAMKKKYSFSLFDQPDERRAAQVSHISVRIFAISLKITVRLLISQLSGNFADLDLSNSYS